MSVRTPLTLALLGLLTLLAFPAVEAMDTSVSLLDCRNYYWDQDRDGHYEAWSTCSTPQCGCMCPVVGGIITITAAGQDQSYAVFASCQSGYGQGHEDSPDPSSIGVSFTPIASGGGLGPGPVLA